MPRSMESVDLGSVERAASRIWGQETTVLSDDRRIYLYADADIRKNDLIELAGKFGLGQEVLEIRSSEEIPRRCNGKVDYQMRF